MALSVACAYHSSHHLILPLHPAGHHIVLVLLSSMPQRYGRLCCIGEGQNGDYMLGHMGQEPIQTPRVDSWHLWQIQ